jgi:hypothetical protein
MADYEVPDLEALLKRAEQADAGDELLEDQDFRDFSPEINRVLLQIREGLPLDDEVRSELEKLFGDWESEGFPIEDEDYEASQEGSPRDFAKDEVDERLSPEEDPDLEPDPEDV